MPEQYSVTASLSARDANFTNTFEQALDVLKSLDRAVHQIATVVLKAQDNMTPVVDDAIKACQQADKAASDITAAKLEATDNMTPTVDDAVSSLEKAKSEATSGIKAQLEAKDNMSPKVNSASNTVKRVGSVIKSVPELILKGRDQSLGKTADQAIAKMDTLSSKIKSGIGFGALMAIGNRAVGALSNGIQDLGHPYVKPTTKKFASFLKFFRAAAIAARSCSIRYSWLMLPFQISPFLKSPA